MSKAERQRGREERRMVQRGRAEYGAHLAEQMRWLRRSAAAFDEGDDSEAKRLATTIRTLVHTTGRSTALLSLIGVRDLWRWCDSSGHGAMRADYVGSAILVDEFGTDEHGQVIVRYRAVMGDLPPGVASTREFEPWWKGAIVRDVHDERFSRFDLIGALANKDGGAHVDAEREARIVELAENNSLAFDVLDSDGTVHSPTNNPILESVRQIAWEVDETVTRYGLG